MVFELMYSDMEHIQVFIKRNLSQHHCSWLNCHFRNGGSLIIIITWIFLNKKTHKSIWWFIDSTGLRQGQPLWIIQVIFTCLWCLMWVNTTVLVNIFHCCHGEHTENQIHTSSLHHRFSVKNLFPPSLGRARPEVLHCFHRLISNPQEE